MSINVEQGGITLLPVQPEELSRIIRENIRAEFETRFPTATDSLNSSSKHKEKDDLLTVEQVRSLLDVTRVTLRQWEKQKKLMPVRLGRRVYYQRSDIDKALSRSI